jgi:hypothetical protein
VRGARNYLQGVPRLRQSPSSHSYIVPDLQTVEAWLTVEPSSMQVRSGCGGATRGAAIWSGEQATFRLFQLPPSHRYCTPD